MPRLARPVGTCNLRESDRELRTEQAMGRKIRVEGGTHIGTGRAGDLTISAAPSRRPEDDPQVGSIGRYSCVIGQMV